VHHSAIIVIEAESYRMHEARQRAASKKRTAKKQRTATNTNKNR